MKTREEHTLYQLLQEQISQNKVLTLTINELRIQLAHQSVHIPGMINYIHQAVLLK